MSELIVENRYTGCVQKKIHSRINFQSAPPANVESGLSHHDTQDSAAYHHTVYKWSANRRSEKMLINDQRPFWNGVCLAELENKLCVHLEPFSRFNLTNPFFARYQSQFTFHLGFNQTTKQAKTMTRFCTETAN